MSLNTPGYPYLELCYCENLTNKLETNVHLHTGQTAPVDLQGMHTTIVTQDPVVQSVISLTNSLRVLFVCVEVLRPSQPNGVMSSAVSLPNHTFTGKA